MLARMENQHSAISRPPPPSPATASVHLRASVVHQLQQQMIAVAECAGTIERERAITRSQTYAVTTFLSNVLALRHELSLSLPLSSSLSLPAIIGTVLPSLPALLTSLSQPLILSQPTITTLYVECLLSLVPDTIVLSDTVTSTLLRGVSAEIQSIVREAIPILSQSPAQALLAMGDDPHTIIELINSEFDSNNARDNDSSRGSDSGSSCESLLNGLITLLESAANDFVSLSVTDFTTALSSVAHTPYDYFQSVALVEESILPHSNGSLLVVYLLSACYQRLQESFSSHCHGPGRLRDLAMVLATHSPSLVTVRAISESIDSARDDGDRLPLYLMLIQHKTHYDFALCLLALPLSLSDTDNDIDKGNHSESIRVIAMKVVAFLLAPSNDANYQLLCKLITQIQSTLASWQASLASPNEHTSSSAMLADRLTEFRSAAQDTQFSMLLLTLLVTIHIPSIALTDTVAATGMKSLLGDLVSSIRTVLNVDAPTFVYCALTSAEIFVQSFQSLLAASSHAASVLRLIERACTVQGHSLTNPHSVIACYSLSDRARATRIKAKSKDTLTQLRQLTVHCQRLLHSHPHSH